MTQVEATYTNLCCVVPLSFLGTVTDKFLKCHVLYLECLKFMLTHCLTFLSRSSQYLRKHCVVTTSCQATSTGVNMLLSPGNNQLKLLLKLPDLACDQNYFANKSKKPKT